MRAENRDRFRLQLKEERFHSKGFPLSSLFSALTSSFKLYFCPMQKIGLIELQYFPSIPFFTKLIAYDCLMLEQHENYGKGSYRNRMHIASANGLLRLSVPLEKGKNQQGAIRDIKISYEEPWQNKHWTAIQSAYGNAPYFEYYAADLLPFFKKKEMFLFDYNVAILQHLCQLIGISSGLVFSEAYVKTPPPPIVDCRNSLSPKANKQQIDPHFKIVPYPQVFQEKTGFLPKLSILDLLFCQGPESILILQQSFVGK